MNKLPLEKSIDVVYIVMRDVLFEFMEIWGVYTNEIEARDHIKNMVTEMDPEEAVLECWEANGSYLWSEFQDKDGNWFRRNVLCIMIDGRKEIRQIPRELTGELPSELQLLDKGALVTFKVSEEGGRVCYQALQEKSNE